MVTSVYILFPVILYVICILFSFRACSFGIDIDQSLNIT